MFKFYSVFSNIKCQPSLPVVKTENFYDDFLRILTKEYKEISKAKPISTKGKVCE